MIVNEKDVAAMKQYLHDYINDKCIVRTAPFDPPMDGKIPGTKCTWQFYLGRGLFNRTFSNYAGVLFWEKFYPHYNNVKFQVAGLETSATPLLSSILLTSSLFDLDVNVFSIKKEKAEYGLRSSFEGNVDPDLPVLLVDDMCSGAGSFYKAVEICVNEDINVLDRAFAIVNHDVQTDQETYLNNLIEVDSIFRTTNFQLTYKQYHVSKYNELNARSDSLLSNN